MIRSNRTRTRWGLFAVPMAVLDVDRTPYCVSSPDEGLSDVLPKEWPHSILASLP